MWRYHLTVFLSAFLLILIELIISKMLLPVYGGSFYVWTTVVMFFQGMIFLGYSYCCVVVQKKLNFLYRYGQVLLVFGALLVFPLRSPEPGSLGQPVLEVVYYLLVAIGLPTFVLCTTTLMLHGWVALAFPRYKEPPYFLYATSNLGSLLALLFYPFILEPLVGIRTQLLLWYIGYGALCLVYLFCLPLRSSVRQAAPRDQETSRQESLKTIPWAQKISWFFLSGCASAFSLAVTNKITLDIASVPLLWIFPLSAYLLSLIITFKRRLWYPALIQRYAVLVVMLVLLCIASPLFTFSRISQIILCTVFTFLITFICHAEISSEKPGEQVHLNIFYLIIALGGWGGSVFVNMIIPLISKVMIEDQLVLFFLGGLLLIRGRPGGKAFPSSRFAYLTTVFAIGTFAVHIGLQVYGSLKQTIFSGRNFYGLQRVVEYRGQRLMMHGNVIHGKQYLSPDKESMATGYYHRDSPIADVLKYPFSQVGIVGLGNATLLSYSQNWQGVDFFEIDPLVVTVAQKYFTYIQKSRIRPRLIMGDARLTLAKAPDRYYDLLIIDAFNSGAIPTHLLTKEAMEIYSQKIKPGGILAFHISNQFIDLNPVLYSYTSLFHFHALTGKKSLEEIVSTSRISDEDKLLLEQLPSSWVVLTRHQPLIKHLTTLSRWVNWAETKEFKKVRVWTDDYVSIFSLLK